MDDMWIGPSKPGGGATKALSGISPEDNNSVKFLILHKYLLDFLDHIDI